MLMASMKVLPSALLPAYDLAIAMRDSGRIFVGGFHTKLERECLEILLRGTQPITICPARVFNEGARLYSGKLWQAVKAGIADGRVTIVTPPGVKGDRITRENATIRNAYLLTVADRVLVLYASPGGATDALAREALQRGLPVNVLDHPGNAGLIEAGAIPVTANTMSRTRGSTWG
ncbi:MAG: hypothetical protein ACR2OU_01845 [Thermomicrobiales bacterium]